MASKYDSIENITKKKEIWRLAVIVDDMWSVYKVDKEISLELIIRDVKGDTIQATIHHDDIATWKPLLKEGSTYYMRNFRVGVNSEAFKMSTHQYQLTFVKDATLVDKLEIPDMKPNSFKFKDFSDILLGKYEATVLVDAIGVVKEVGKCVNGTDTKKASVAFKIADLRDNVLDCTLWDGLSGQFLDYYNKNCDYPIVVILKHARVKEPTGSYPLQLCNVWNGTKLVFDSVPEIIDFRASLPKDYPVATQNLSFSNSTPGYTHGGSSYQSSADDTFIKGHPVMRIGEIKKLKIETFCVTVVKTEHIKTSNQGWYFRGCNECNLKCDGGAPPFVCKKGHSTNDPLIKYKVDVEVKDGDEGAKFVFWDNSLNDLLGITAAALLEKMKKDGRIRPSDYPEELDEFMDRTFAFRVKWQPGWGSGQATVLECRDSQELVNKILEQLPSAETVCKESDLDLSTGDQHDQTPHDKIVQIFTHDDIAKFGNLDETIMSTPNVSICSENDVSASSNKTPAKRPARKKAADESVEAQLSSTKGGKLIKKEK